MLLNPTISILDSKVKLREVRDLSKVTETPLSKICGLPSITSSKLGLTEEKERERTGWNSDSKLYTLSQQIY